MQFLFLLLKSRDNHFHEEIKHEQKSKKCVKYKNNPGPTWEVS